MSLRPRFFVMSGMVLVILGCARRPTREIQEARRRLADAERAEAPLYARASFEEARRDRKSVV